MKYTFTLLSFFIMLLCFEQTAAQNPYITVWKTNNSGETNDLQIEIRAKGEYTYAWEKLDENQNPTGETGSGEASGKEVITFPAAGYYQIEMASNSENDPFRKIKFNEKGDLGKLVEIKQWGDIQWSTFKQAYRGVKNLKITATDIPDLSQVTDMRYAFAYTAIDEVPNINDWDVSTVENLKGTFREAKQFNENIAHWDVSNVETMKNLFRKAKKFNQPLENWDVSSVENMKNLFRKAENFNQNIGNWEVSNVENMKGIFRQTKKFNHGLNDWNVSNVKDLSNAFRKAKAFNKTINNWDVSNVENMRKLFQKSKKFNQSLNSWDVSNVTEMERIFELAENYNHSLEQWKLNSIEDGNFSLAESGMDCENYSLTLYGWAHNPDIAPFVVLESSDMELSEEIMEERNTLTDEYHWIIAGDAPGSCDLSTISYEKKRIEIYPNPAETETHINGLKSGESFMVYDINGKTILEETLFREEEEEEEEEKTIDVSKYPKGLYWIKINSDNGDYTTKKLLVK